MGKLEDVKGKLDALYLEYRDNKNSLNGAKTKEVNMLLLEMVTCREIMASDIAVELARFSAEVCKLFFENFTMEKRIPLPVVEDIFVELRKTDKDPKASQYYVSKYSFGIAPTLKSYGEECYKSTILPELVVFIARYAVKEKYKPKFYALVNNTQGSIYSLNYSSLSHNAIEALWNATTRTYPDLTNATYYTIIAEWAIKYGFMKDETQNVVTTSTEHPLQAPDNSDNNEKVSDPDNAPSLLPKTGSSVLIEGTPRNETVSNDEDKHAGDTAKKRTDSVDEVIKQPIVGTSMEELYNRIQTTINAQQDSILSSISTMLKPVDQAFETIKGEITKSRDIAVENNNLKAHVSDLEAQITTVRNELNNSDKLLKTATSEVESLRNQLYVAEQRNVELDTKLNDAYSINSRESSLEAEKIRFELQKAFHFLYEDWLEYEFSDVSEENYESLQAIIKKVFRALEKNGIAFKESN